ncbi:DoxX family protein, partial [Streptomyces sp. NPDC047976]|uniref:DoxX family protein n=1 Tax=Streptomyces sp. NPDC047976 TaxID=3155746 RepID=UPI003439E289
MSCINRRDLALLALRAGTGAVLMAHGTQKLFGWFGGGGVLKNARRSVQKAVSHRGQSPISRPQREDPPR